MHALRTIPSGLVDDGRRDDHADDSDEPHAHGSTFDATIGEDTVDDEGTVDAPAVRHAVLPAISAFEAGHPPLFGDYASTRNVQRARMFRTQRPRAQRQFDKNGNLRPVPRPIRGTIPLAALHSPTSVFSDEAGAQMLKGAVDSLLAGGASEHELNALDEHLPWGPQFVTGFVFKQPPNGAAVFNRLSEPCATSSSDDSTFSGSATTDACCWAKNSPASTPSVWWLTHAGASSPAPT